jgi:hypothetical protein
MGRIGESSLTAHPKTMTDSEFREVASFWRDWINKGGEGEAPSPFQLEALNNFDMRDAFLFWQVGGNPGVEGEKIPPKTLMAYNMLGALPEDENKNRTLKALVKAIELIEAEDDMVDTVTVFMLSTIMWCMKLKQWAKVDEMIEALNKMNLKVGRRPYHYEPIGALMYSQTLFKLLPEEMRVSASRALLGVKPYKADANPLEESA